MLRKKWMTQAQVLCPPVHRLHMIRVWYHKIKGGKECLPVGSGNRRFLKESWYMRKRNEETYKRVEERKLWRFQTPRGTNLLFITYHLDVIRESGQYKISTGQSNEAVSPPMNGRKTRDLRMRISSQDIPNHLVMGRRTVIPSKSALGEFCSWCQDKLPLLMERIFFFSGRGPTLEGDIWKFAAGCFNIHFVKVADV